ncbi:ComEC/Rec2 family competence protein [Chlamydia trachomatis]|uniref:Competence protein ComE n=2 Tax=Chlamydia muridarum TaxID=83560 RepID=A0A070A4F7_CHLMR|nr:ComEC/Rec2 family competence protein [Chlamydia muridarum]UFT43090.1 ComEC/Rec2 family competence protein [Chlamydia trachomatis]AAF39448.1 conserved hypothetical protein [Chlamydia muridarum str. Nigg]AHH23004.1 competence protein ComE [Chlamydia muridarum str. Nigg3 CMUT3-5]AHH23929.1 competence protein ComE [Chlamydia muridarum str. Nigg CM972]AID38136.1 competence protein ComE [Chlamydia muridarum str. Nigg 2 MCR]
MLSHLCTTAFLTSLHRLSSLWIRLLNSCSVFQRQHPFFIGGAYWFAGILAHEAPICCALLIVALHPFIPKYCVKTLFFFFLCFGCPLLFSPFGTSTSNKQFTVPASKIRVDKGPASGYFLVKKTGNRAYSSIALSLETENKHFYQDLPCSLVSSTPLNEQTIYHLQGIISKSSYPITFRVSNLIEKTALSAPKLKNNPFSFFPIFKENFRKSLHKKLINLFPNQDIGRFSSSLILGTPLPYKQKELFKSKGLSHLFSVSGWHFSLFANVLFFVLGDIPPKKRGLLVMFLLSLLNLVFPTSPSVFRSWFSSILFCLAPFSIGYCSSLNRLGISFICCSLIFPLSSPALILSFLATLGILFFYTPLLRFFYSPWKLLFGNRWFLFPIRFLFTTLSISIAAQLFIIFPMIRMFKILPLDGLIYNLFYPTLVVPIFLLIPLSFFIPLLSRFSESYIAWILTLNCLHAPNILISLTSAPLSLEWISLFSILLFYLGVFLSTGKASNPSVNHSIII